MKRTITLVVLLVAAALTINSGHAQSAKPGVEKLYILNCGEGVAGEPVNGLDHGGTLHDHLPFKHWGTARDRGVA